MRMGGEGVRESIHESRPQLVRVDPIRSPLGDEVLKENQVAEGLGGNTSFLGAGVPGCVSLKDFGD
jgi:hypothetical protein